MTLRRLGTTDMTVSPVAMGCWPIAGITSIGVTEADSLATLTAAYEAGINFFDTAYCYGYEGESERLIAKALGPHRDQIILASKCGIHWDADRKQVKDGRPDTIHRECEESLERLKTDRIDLYYLHAPDPNVPIRESAGALRELLDAGKVRAVGVSNIWTIPEFEEFEAECPITASQPHYNLLQREIDDEILPWCRSRSISTVVYWPLMKGFLAGKLRRDHVWDPKDGRQKYPIFSGEEWDKTHDFVDRLRGISDTLGCTVAQLAVAWVLQRPGITSALCGAKRPEQIEDTAVAMNITFTEAQLNEIDAAIQARGPVASRRAVQ